MQQVLNNDYQNVVSFVSVREHLGFPEFRPAAELSDEELAAEWDRVQALYKAKGWGIEFKADYPLFVCYDFMAIEAMDKQMLPIPNCYLVYEHYHPNHDFDQRNRTEEFMKGFFEGKLDEAVLAQEIVVPEQERQMPLAEAQALIDRFHGLFAEIKDWDLYISKTSAQTDEEMKVGAPRLGYTEGLVRYSFVLPDNSEQKVEGPFKLYMACENASWVVTCFQLPGFSWK